MTCDAAGVRNAFSMRRLPLRIDTCEPSYYDHAAVGERCSLIPKGGIMKVIVDESHWPIVVVTWPAKVSDDAWNEYRRHHMKLLSRDQGFAIVNDHTLGGAPTLSQRRSVIQLFVEREADLRRLIKGTAIVSRSALVRGAVTAVTWLKPPPFPFVVFGDLGEAMSWAQARLRAPGVEC